MKINKYCIDKSQDVILQTKQLISFINNIVEDKNFTNFSFCIAREFKIPINVIKFETKSFLLKNHDFKIGTFSKIFKLIYLPLSIFKFFFFLIFINLFSINYKKNKKVEIIFDEILSEDELIRNLSFFKKFKTYKIICSQKLKNDKNYFIYNKHIGVCKRFLIKNIFSILFRQTFIIFCLSIKAKVNFFPIYLNHLKKIIKYETIFNVYRADFLFQERPYTTSAIKNYIFKKYGGKKTCCTQRILFHLGQTGCYIHTDILFCLGKKTAKILKITGSKIKKVIPIGSTVFYNKWLNSKKIKTDSIDIIHLSGNDAPKFKTDNKYLKNYYEQLNWLKRLSLDFPKLKIVIKHHENNKVNDKKELEIIKDTKIIRILDPTKPGKINYSYGYAINSKIRLTWCSTMAYELIGHGYPCFFLDPKMQNNAFLHKFKYNKNFRISSYEDLKKKVNKIANIKSKIMIKNKDDFCLKSENILNKIIYFLKK